jgi:hypothetical protein
LEFRVQLNLQFPPTPEFANQHSNLVVAAAKKFDNVDLDYSVASLELADDLVERFRREGLAVEQIAETLFSLGCYVGEVFVRHAHATWRAADETPMKDVAGYFLVIELGAEHFANPIGKVFKRFENGTEDYLPYFFTVFARPADPTPPSPSPKQGWFRRLVNK